MLKGWTNIFQVQKATRSHNYAKEKEQVKWKEKIHTIKYDMAHNSLMGKKEFH